MRQKRSVVIFLGSVIICAWLVANFWFFFYHKLAEDGVISPVSNIFPLIGPTPLPDPVTWSLFLTGDIIPARVTNQKMVEKNDFMWPLAQIQPILKDASLTLINLEAPLLTHCPVTNEGFKFCGDSKFAQSLENSGVDIANLANNHSLNYSWEGILETEEHLQDVGIETTGFFSSFQSSVVSHQTENKKTIEKCNNSIYCSKLTIKYVQNIKIGFLGYNAVGQRVDRKITEAEIKAAKKQVDVLVVSVHWGKEYTHIPLPDTSLAPDNPIELGTLFIDWGADIVAGNHPHWVQNINWYHDRPIIYAQGNTVFDQDWSKETKRGVLVKLYFSGTTILKNQFEVVPIGVRDWGQAYILEGEDKEEVLRIFTK